MKGNPIINARIEYFTKRKETLLKMKKSQRRGELKTVDDAIVRLKRWNRELEIQQKMKRIEQATEMMKNGGIKITDSMKKTMEAMGELQKAMTVL